MFEVFDIAGQRLVFQAYAAVAAGAEQTYSSQSRGAANEGTATEAILGRFGYSRCMRCWRSGWFPFGRAGGRIPYPQC